ncbi:hypothetical protein Tco_0059030 [Tanacetum coccineum]
MNYFRKSENDRSVGGSGNQGIRPVSPNPFEAATYCYKSFSRIPLSSAPTDCYIEVEPGLLLQGPLENSTNKTCNSTYDLVPFTSSLRKKLCIRQVTYILSYTKWIGDMPSGLSFLPSVIGILVSGICMSEDSIVAAALAFRTFVMICWVEERIVGGSIEGSVVHIQGVRTVIIRPSGAISSSGLEMLMVGQGRGCRGDAAGVEVRSEWVEGWLGWFVGCDVGSVVGCVGGWCYGAWVCWEGFVRDGWGLVWVVKVVGVVSADVGVVGWVVVVMGLVGCWVWRLGVMCGGVVFVGVAGGGWSYGLRWCSFWVREGVLVGWWVWARWMMECWGLCRGVGIGVGYLCGFGGGGWCGDGGGCGVVCMNWECVAGFGGVDGGGVLVWGGCVCGFSGGYGWLGRRGWGVRFGCVTGIVGVVEGCGGYGWGRWWGVGRVGGGGCAEVCAVAWCGWGGWSALCGLGLCGGMGVRVGGDVVGCRAGGVVVSGHVVMWVWWVVWIGGVGGGVGVGLRGGGGDGCGWFVCWWGVVVDLWGGWGSGWSWVGWVGVGSHLFNLGETSEKLEMVARMIAAIENPQDIIVQSARRYGQRAVSKL